MGTLYQERLRRLRAEMDRGGLSGFIIPHADEHNSEYTPACAERLAWITGFDGSAGVAVVLNDAAALFVDGRYTLQARQQVDANRFSLQKSHDNPVEDWIGRHAVAGQRIGYDPWLHNVVWLEHAREMLARHDIELVAVDDNLVDAIWQDRPAAPDGPAHIHDLVYSGEESIHKRARMAAMIKAAGADLLVLTALDSIAWLLNIRGTDSPHTPIVQAFALLSSDGTLRLYIDDQKLDENLRGHLGPEVTVLPKADFTEALRQVGATHAVMVDAKLSPAAVFDALDHAGAKIIRGDDPCQLAKACKNETELTGIRQAHIRDGVALCQFLCWLDENVASDQIDEMTAARQVDIFRAKQPLFMDSSFDTIAGAGPNGAIVHYRVTEDSSRMLEDGDLFLLDSGGQYLDGTTDVTRTIAIGQPNREQRDRFTRVLKGHIALAQARFPQGRAGAHLDVLARKPLWDVGLDFDHGTGHGVGQYLSVHEGPQSISARSFGVALQPGMILSNEPGYYKAGAYGIRIENLVRVVNSQVTGQERAMLAFETLTLAPIDLRLIDVQLLTVAEVTWLNIYHNRVRQTLMPHLSGKDASWLEDATRALQPD
ncbi:MAG: X-Pro aminopeptidase [Kordiimonas sp.]|nr:X-Pro aminopeptidase [Kordiimonas sp.]